MDSSRNNFEIFSLVPNKNGLHHLKYCLESLRKTVYSNHRLVLIDDHSEDESIRFVETWFPDVKIIQNHRSQGFAGAVNSGILYAIEKGANAIAVCNNDIKVLPNWIDLVIDLFNNQEKVGLIGFNEILREKENLFYEWNGKEQISYKIVTGLPGCLYICSADAIRSVGLYDEAYFMYGEDNDYFARTTKAGYSLIQTNIPVWHYGEGSSGKKKFKNTWLAYRNALRYVVKNETPAKIIKMLMSLMNLGCNPFLSRKINDPNYNRLRRYNIAVNFGLILSSCLWNLFNVVPTLRARYERNSKIKTSLNGRLSKQL
jgi:GT2 family glycosyltransferase